MTLLNQTLVIMLLTLVLHLDSTLAYKNPNAQHNFIHSPYILSHTQTLRDLSKH